MTKQRVVENLNQAFHQLFSKRKDVFLIGEDVQDAYGGAFKVSRGLSSQYPDQVISTPISEPSIIGVAAGMALCGDKAIAEIMFGDFMTLGFDQLTNFAAKSVSMYGQTLPLNLIVRTPMGGGRAYGPTHSQSLQKHFIGVPNLKLYELSPFHDNLVLLESLLEQDCPCVLFEDKILYTRYMIQENPVNELFQFENLKGANDFIRVFSSEFEESNCLVITGGGCIERCLGAMKALFLEYEIECQAIVPSCLYPMHVDPLASIVANVERIFVVEEGTQGGNWGHEVAKHLYEMFWADIKHPIVTICSKDSIIPSSKHLEKEVLIQQENIVDKIAEVVGGTN